MGKGLERPHEEQLRVLGLFSLEKTEGETHCSLQHPRGGRGGAVIHLFTLMV